MTEDTRPIIECEECGHATRVTNVIVVPPGKVGVVLDESKQAELMRCPEHGLTEFVKADEIDPRCPRCSTLQAPRLYQQVPYPAALTEEGEEADRD